MGGRRGRGCVTVAWHGGGRRGPTRVRDVSPRVRTRWMTCSGSGCSPTCAGSCGRAYGPGWRTTRSSGWNSCAGTAGVAGRRLRGDVWRNCVGRLRGDVRGAGAGAAGRPARLAPARGQAGLVAVLLPPHAEPGRTDPRAGRAGRAHRRRRGGPGQEVGGAAVPLPAAGTQVLPGRHGLRSGHGQAVDSLRRGRRTRDNRPEDGQHLLRAVARSPGRGGAAQDLGATGPAAGSR